MSERRAPRYRSAIGSGFEVQLSTFLAALAAAGYAEKTQHDKRRLIGPFARWAAHEGLAAANLEEAHVDMFLARRVRRRGNLGRTALLHFLEYLRTFGAAPPRRPPEPVVAEVLVRKYLDYLRRDRGLCARSIEIYSHFVRAFVEAHGLPERVASLGAPAVRGYLLERSQGRSISFVKLLAATLRSFLRFLFVDQATSVDLSTAVPPVRRWGCAAVPPLLTHEEVERVIASIDRSTARGRRTLAIVLLLARLGLRAGEVVTLELGDIRWDVGEILVRGKGRLNDRLPLLDDVGEAMVLYLRDARGPSTSRRVFLRLLAPRVGLSGPHAVSVVARNALRHAGLQPTGRVGAHVFRHGLATQSMRGGASLTEISQLLRHRAIATTQIYAKVDIEALRGVVLPWPKMEAPR